MFGTVTLILIFAFLLGLAFTTASLFAAILFHPILGGVLWIIALIILVAVYAFCPLIPVFVWFISGAWLLIAGIVIGIAFIFWLLNFFSFWGNDCDNDKGHHHHKAKDSCNKCGSDAGCGCLFDVNGLMSIKDESCCNPCNMAPAPPAPQKCYQPAPCASSCPSPPPLPCSPPCQQPCANGCANLAEAIAGQSRMVVSELENGNSLLQHQIYNTESGSYNTMFTAECSSAAQQAAVANGFAQQPPIPAPAPIIPGFGFGQQAQVRAAGF